MTTTQKILLAAALAVIAAGIYQAHQNSFLCNQIQTLQQQQLTLTEQIAGFKSANESISNRLWASRSPSLSSERLRELLRLRAEVGALRRRQLELEQAAAQAKEHSAVSALSAVTPTPRVPAPFQVQLVLDGPGENAEALTNNAGEILNVQKTPLLDHTAIRSATVTQNTASGTPEIEVEFSQEGKELFAAITRENLNKQLVIVLNGQVFSAPVIRSEIAEGKAQITGRFTQEEATELAARINDAIGEQ